MKEICSYLHTYVAISMQCKIQCSYGKIFIVIKILIKRNGKNLMYKINYYQNKINCKTKKVASWLCTQLVASYNILLLLLIAFWYKIIVIST